MDRRVIVTGVGIITAHGIGKQINWQKSRDGVNSIKEITSFDSSIYRGRCGGEASEFVETSLRNLRKTRLDRASHLLIHTVREAITESDILLSLKSKDIFLSLGTTLGGMLSGETFHRTLIEKGINRAQFSLVLDYLAHSQTLNLFKEFGLKGDFMVFSDACASGTNAMGHAFNAIRSGEYDIAICGGYDTMSEFTFAGFNSLMAVSPTWCRPFDRHRDGLALGEGAGVLIFEELEFAKKRGAKILGEVLGYGMSSDAFHLTSPEQSGESAAVAITKALSLAGNPEIDYINAHGTGTKLNDLTETRAIKKAFGDKAKHIPVSSIKPMIGHTLGGAGAVEAIISIFSIMHKTLLPNINYKDPDPECDLNIVKVATIRKIRNVLSNSFGFSGLNASIIFGECP